MMTGSAISHKSKAGFARNPKDREFRSQNSGVRMGTRNSWNNGTGSKTRGHSLTQLFDKQAFYETNFKNV